MTVTQPRTADLVSRFMVLTKEIMPEDLLRPLLSVEVDY